MAKFSNWFAKDPDLPAKKPSIAAKDLWAFGHGDRRRVSIEKCLDEISFVRDPVGSSVVYAYTRGLIGQNGINHSSKMGHGISASAVFRF